jgi:hypothetical protein
LTASDAHKRAAVKYRQKQRRVEILIDPRSDEARALDRLVEAHGSVSAAVRFALLKA